MNNIDQQFLDLIKNIYENGSEIQTRNSKVKRLTGLTIKVDKTPLVSIRRTAWKHCIYEWEWFMSGSNNIYNLNKKVRPWWEPWANVLGLIHFNYSKQFREFHGNSRKVDQIDYFINSIKHHPNSRRCCITTWNTADMTNPANPITNCHTSYLQAFVEPDNSLHFSTYQRSSDMVLGFPHNLMQMWAFLLWVSYLTNRTPGSIMWTIGDAHIYEEHYDIVEEMLKTDISNIKTPNLIYNPTSLDFKADDFSLDNKYEPIIKKSIKMIV